MGTILSTHEKAPKVGEPAEKARLSVVIITSINKKVNIMKRRLSPGKAMP